MSATVFIVTTVFNLYLMVVLLRLWLQLVRADFYNPFSQFVVKATHPVVGPMRRIIPSIGAFDFATLVLALLVAIAKYFVLSLFAIKISPLGLLIYGALAVVKEFLSLVFYLLILRAILSWVSQGRSAIEYVMQQLTEPFLAPIRRIIPPIGGLDLSVLVAIIALQALQIVLRPYLPAF